MNFPYRLAVFDMDETLLGPDHEISRENVDALHRLLSLGVEVVIASGRHHINIVEFEGTLGFKGWVISAGGAVLRHAETEEVLFEVCLPQEYGLELFNRARAEGYSVVSYHRTGIFCDGPSEWITAYEKRTHQVPIADIPQLVASGIQKLIWTTAPAKILELTPQLQHEYQGRVYVVHTEPEMVEFLNTGANKARATEALAAKLGIGREQIIAFGDGNNDVPLLEWAGMSVAMAHGRESARKAAKKVSPPGNPGTAVARSLKEFFK